MSNVLEIVTFKLANGVNEADFVKTHDAFQAYLDSMPGLLYRSLAKQADSDTYVDVVYWASLADAERVQQAFATEPRCQALMTVIDADSVVMTLNHIIAQTPCNG